MSEQGGRYQRSFSGMVGAMIVLVVLVVAFVLVRGLNRSDPSVEPDRVDYLDVVRGVARADGDPVAYPPRLPDGWFATSASFGAEGIWSLSLLTDDEEFVGVRQSRGTESVEELVTTYVDDAAEEGDPVSLDSPLAPSWRSFTDSGGDYALVAEVEDSIVLVVGTAPEQEIQDLAASLTMDPPR
ncbi:MAG: DUF4245 family protein [Nocardioides sp.]